MAAKMSLKTAAADHQNLNDGLSLLFGASTPSPNSEESAITQIPIALIDTHPKQGRWSMNEDELNWLASNIAQVGVLDPILVMQKPNGRYLLLAGHRRREGALRAGLEKIPAIVEPYDEQRAEIIFNATNLGQRAKLRPSEKAYAYADLEHAVGEGKRTTAAISQLTGDNIREIQRYKRLTALIPSLLSLVDEGSIPLYAGVDLAGLTEEEQADLLTVINRHSCRLSLKQAAQLKSAAQDTALTENAIEALLFPSKPPKPASLSLKLDSQRFGAFIPQGCSPAQALDLIQRALAFYADHNNG